MTTKSAADWPRITLAVAEALLGEPDTQRSTAREMHWPHNGGFYVQRETGKWYCFAENTGGSAIDLVCWRLSLEKDAAVQWLKDKGYLTGGDYPPQPGGRANRPPPAAPRPKAPQQTGKRVFTKEDSLKYALQRWAASVPVPMDASSPARRWMADRNLWPPGVPAPQSIRLSLIHI